MSLAARHRARKLASQTGASGLAAGHGDTDGRAAIPFQPAPVRSNDPADIARAQMSMRLTHDLRRLKEIASIEGKIAAKREMLPEYAAWVEGLLASGAPAIADDVLPTIMIWRIDVGDIAGAMPLIHHVIRHKIALPARYERSAPALIVEEVAGFALKAQRDGQRFPLELLEEIEPIADDHDMHDEIKAKLAKAIAIELMFAAEAIDAADPGAGVKIDAARAKFVRARQLHDGSGVNTYIMRLGKAAKKVAAAQVATPPAPAPDTTQQTGTAG